MRIQFDIAIHIWSQEWILRLCAGNDHNFFFTISFVFIHTSEANQIDF